MANLNYPELHKKQLQVKKRFTFELKASTSLYEHRKVSLNFFAEIILTKKTTLSINIRKNNKYQKGYFYPVTCSQISLFCPPLD